MGLRPRCFQTQHLRSHSPRAPRLRLPAAGGGEPAAGRKGVPLQGSGAKAAPCPWEAEGVRRPGGELCPLTAAHLADVLWVGPSTGRRENQLTCFSEPLGQPYKEAAASSRRRWPGWGTGACRSRRGAPLSAAVVSPTEHPGNGPCACSPRGCQAQGKKKRAERVCPPRSPGLGRACRPTDLPPARNPASPHPTWRLHRRKTRGADAPLLP